MKIIHYYLCQISHDQGSGVNVVDGETGHPRMIEGGNEDDPEEERGIDGGIEDDKVKGVPKAEEDENKEQTPMQMLTSLGLLHSDANGNTA